MEFRAICEWNWIQNIFCSFLQGITWTLWRKSWENRIRIYLVLFTYRCHWWRQSMFWQIWHIWPYYQETKCLHRTRLLWHLEINYCHTVPGWFHWWSPSPRLAAFVCTLWPRRECALSVHETVTCRLYCHTSMLKHSHQCHRLFFWWGKWNH